MRACNTSFIGITSIFKNQFVTGGCPQDLALFIIMAISFHVVFRFSLFNLNCL